MKTPTCPSLKCLSRLCALILPLGLTAAFGQDDYSGQDATNGNFTHTDNWVGAVAPVNGGDLVFGTVTATQTTAHNNNDLDTIGSITFAAGTTQSFTVNGSGPTNNNVTLTNTSGSAISNLSAQTQTVSFGGNGIVLGGTSQQFSTATGNLSVTSNITLNSTELTLLSGTGQIMLSGNITGNGSSGEPALAIGNGSTGGNVVLSGNNSGMSSVTLFQGTLTIGSNKALGSGELIVFGSGSVLQTIATTQSQTIANSIGTANNFTFAPTGTLKINGALDIRTPGLVITNSSGMSTGIVQFNGGITSIASSGLIQFSGVGNSSDPSEFIISGSTASTYNSAITVEVSNNAFLDLNVNPAHGAITGGLTIDAGSQAAIEQNNQLSTTTTLTANGLFTMNGHNETISDLEGTGTVSIGNGGTFTVTTNNFGGTLAIGGGGKLVLSGGTFTGALTDGSLGAGGIVDKEGAGTFTLNGTSNYSGNTIINGGTFIAGQTNALDANSRYEVNSGGTLAMGNFNNTIGELADNGTGGIVENGGPNNADLTVGDNNQNSNFHGTIEDGASGLLGLTKVGSDTLILSGNNSYSGATTIMDGKIAVNSATALGNSTVFVDGGELRVAGKNGPTAINVMGVYDQTGGTLRLAVYSPTTNGSDSLQVQGGSVNLGSGSTLKLAFPSGGGLVTSGITYDLVHSSGGGITGMFGTVTGLNNFTLDPGTFDTVVYTSTDVTLAFRQFLAMNANLTPNQATVANVLDRLEGQSTSGSYGTVVNGLYSLSSSGLPGALDQLSPQKFASFTSTTAFNNASFETQAMDDYLDSQRSGPNGTFLGGNGSIDTSHLTINDPNYDPSLAMVHSRLLAWNAAPYSEGLLSDSDAALGGVDMKDMKAIPSAAYNNPWNFFVRGSVILAQGFSQADVPHFDDNTESVVVGMDYRITPNFLVGLSAGYAHTDVTLDNNGSSATVDSYSPGLYAAFADKGWYANFSGSYIHNAYTESRAIAFIGQTANGAPEGNEGVANLDGGYEFHKGAFTFGPLAGIQYTHLSVDGYSETGSDADLNVNGDDSDSLRSRLGGRISFNMMEGGVSFSPHLEASWQHEFFDQSRGITSQFNTFGGGAFSVRTDNPSRDSALVDAGLDINVTGTMTVFADYMVQAGQANYFGQSVQAGVKIGF